LTRPSTHRRNLQFIGRDCSESRSDSSPT
jgi:hypothetical protein